MLVVSFYSNNIWSTMAYTRTIDFKSDNRAASNDRYVYKSLKLFGDSASAPQIHPHHKQVDTVVRKQNAASDNPSHFSPGAVEKINAAREQKESN